MTYIQKIALGVAGITTLGIGSLILIAPQAFYASYGIALGPGPSLLSELRAPGAGLAAFGGVILAGIVTPSLRQAAVVVALTIFLAFPTGRLLGLLIDGMPSGGILAALGLELAIAGLCLFAFRRGTGPAVGGLAAR
ncbi:DUF4345 domain-containing protein [Defluviimonas aestuarii]|uniref:DUF4345 domain-containing protein n=1 Tax=Albidovulum aestuarii TaxID=1130726 RepID=UPI00249A3165|nr:DUF4345 domain-containing protein [Defluviimonas aestuarii]MDI3337710.1 DUF4345 domain-containing protein [Defluviimonas aestuarii]